MAQPEFLPLHILVILIEGVSVLVIAGHCVGGLYVLAVTRNIRQAQWVVADGALLGFSIKLIATLLTVIQLQTWGHIAMFVCVFTLRAVLKKVLLWDRKELEGVESGMSDVRA